MISTIKHICLGLGFLLTLSGTASAADTECLVISDSSVEEIESRPSVTTAEWSAVIKNVCDKPYDGTLTIRLKDSNGNTLYEAVQIVVINSAQEVDTNRRINIGSNEFKAYEEVDIELTERERPR